MLSEESNSRIAYDIISNADMHCKLIGSGVGKHVSVSFSNKCLQGGSANITLAGLSKMVNRTHYLTHVYIKHTVNNARVMKCAVDNPLELLYICESNKIW